MQQVLEELVVNSNKDHYTQMIIKGKRTKRQRLPSPLRLAMPSSSSSYCNSKDNSLLDLASTTTTIDQLRDRNRTEEEEDMANCLILLAQGNHNHNHHNKKSSSSESGIYLYQCKTCNRCFPSFQALGGHRASHKKLPKPNYGTEEKEKQRDHYCDPTTTNTTLSLQIPYNSTTTTTTTTTKLSKVHECSICGAEFSSGQALGGHMRRHRTTLVSTNSTTTTTTTTTITTSMSGSGSPEFQEAKKPRNVLKLDLNLPAAPEDIDQRESKFPNLIVFSTSSLVDCHY